MKANAPEKIYIQSFNVSEEDTKFDKSKLFFDDIWVEEPEPGQENIEYTRTDAFIEKACDAFCKVCKIPSCRSNECKWISDFKGHLENT